MPGFIVSGYKSPNILSAYLKLRIKEPQISVFPTIIMCPHADTALLWFCRLTASGKGTILPIINPSSVLNVYEKIFSFISIQNTGVQKDSSLEIKTSPQFLDSKLVADRYKI